MAQIWQESGVGWKISPPISAEHTESSPPKVFPSQELWASKVEVKLQMIELEQFQSIIP